MGHRIRRGTWIGALSTALVLGALTWAPSGESAPYVKIIAAGDFQNTVATTAVLGKMRDANPHAVLAVGDLSYDNQPETAWCSFVKSTLGEGFPFELVAGNHESNGQNGHINNFSSCLPNQIPGVVGTYGREYYFDLPSAAAPLVRVIMASPNQTFPEGWWDSRGGTSHYAWLSQAIDSARAGGIKHVVVGIHYPCITTGLSSGQPCAMQADVFNLLLAKKVDMLVVGHDHTYQRSHQLALGPGCTAIDVNATDPDCIVDSDGDFVAGAGMVYAIVGTGGAWSTSVSPTDPRAGYFAKAIGVDTDGGTFGALQLELTDTTLTGTFLRAHGAPFSDSFTIGPPPSGPPATPTSVTAAATGPTTADVSWRTVLGAGSYPVLRCQGSGCTPSTEVGSSTTGSFSDTGLTPESVYRYQVTARNASGDSAPSAIVDVTTPAAGQPPAAPDTVAASATGSTSARVTWSASNGAASYAVLRCAGTACTPSTQVWSGAATSYDDSGLAPASDYSYAVVATNTYGSSVPSAAVPLRTADPPLGPSVLLAERSTWRWRYIDNNPPSGWNQPGFDDRGWLTGPAPLGYGYSNLGTNILTAPGLPNPRPRSLQVRSTFTVADPAVFSGMTLTTRADDGVVVFLNGVEVARGNMPTGTVTPSTYPTAAPATPTPVVVSVPATALRAGTNTIAAYTNLNYRSTANVSFEAQLVAAR